jgi:hypothetical protein
VKDGKPMLGSKELKGWIEEERKDFLPSLFPQSKGSLPTGSSAGNPPKEEKPNPMGSFQQGYVKALEKTMGVS